MRLAWIALLLWPLAVQAQEVVPAGITCCDEALIRSAMTEEALRRVAGEDAGGAWASDDYLTLQARERLRGRLPAGGGAATLDFLRRALDQPGADDDLREFQKLIGHFVLGMTLEIGHTFQFEYDQAAASCARTRRLAAELERPEAGDDGGVSRALFRADIGERELRRLRALPGKWRRARDDAGPFDEFCALRRNLTGLPPDADQKPVFSLAVAYNDRYPFLDEFLDNFRRLAEDFHAAVLEVNEKLSQIEGQRPGGLKP